MTCLCLLFSLHQPAINLTATKCSLILKKLVTDADLDTSIFMAKTFCKLGVVAGIHAGI
jgi:hypothetical protein